ncbi:zinc-dependent peptidase [Verrucomicrobia bacterium]|nr:zinc-dependent peptidase [Verrucomicrobiota bacterium]MDC0218625.1 zinc-dependent peptidase [Verrucomicrobiota bacterium]
MPEKLRLTRLQMSLAGGGLVLALIIIIFLLFVPIYVTIYGDPLDNGKKIPLYQGILAIAFFWIPVLFIGWVAAGAWWGERKKERDRRVEREQKLNQRKKYILKREVELKGQRLSLNRQERLQKLSPLYRKLPEELKFKLEEHIILFQEIVEFKKWRIEEVTEIMRDIVSVDACLLIINRGLLDYLYLDFVEIWGTPIRLMHSENEMAGQARPSQVRLTWDSVEFSNYDGGDNFNVTLHEFAHVLDFTDDKIANSIPVSRDSPEHSKWKSLLDREYPKLQEAYQRNQAHVLDDYAITDPNRAEFFSCATESFFERSAELKKSNPEIYSLFQNFYKLDPASWKNSGI